MVACEPQQWSNLAARRNRVRPRRIHVRRLGLAHRDPALTPPIDTERNSHQTRPTRRGRGISVGKVLISLAALYTRVGAFKVDFNETHIYNPKWPPGAAWADPDCPLQPTTKAGIPINQLTIQSAVLSPLLLGGYALESRLRAARCGHTRQPVRASSGHSTDHGSRRPVQRRTGAPVRSLSTPGAVLIVVSTEQSA